MRIIEYYKPMCVIYKIIEDFLVQFNLIYEHMWQKALLLQLIYRIAHDHSPQSSLINNSNFYMVACKVVEKFSVQSDLIYTGVSYIIVRHFEWKCPIIYHKPIENLNLILNKNSSILFEANDNC